MYQPKKNQVTVTSGMIMEFFKRVCILLFTLEAPTSYMQKPTWIRNIKATVSQ